MLGNNSTEQFIKNLSQDLLAETPVRKPQTRFVLWFFVSIVLVASIMGFIQEFRPGFQSQLLNKQFLIETFFAFGSALSCGLLLYFRSVPGLKISKALYFVGLVPICGFLIFNFAGHQGFLSLAPSMHGKRPFCFYEVLAWSWLPILFMVMQLRKSYFDFNLRRSFFVGLAAATFPMALMQVACMYEPQHILSHHIVPVFYVAIAFTLMSSWILRSRL